MDFVHRFDLKTPAPVSTISFGTDDTFAVGSDDGTVRVYTLPAINVVKAIRGLEHDVSSVIWLHKPSDSDAGTLWIASGHMAHCFALQSEKMILGVADASATLELGEDEEDVLNELSLHDTKKHLAFSTDGGTTGVVELSSNNVMRMKTRHTNICSSVKFVPDRPAELVSGGYDSAILHFDFKQNTLLSRQDIASAPATSGISLSPPFVLSLSLSATGLVAATTADGRLWVGGGGDKAAPFNNKKKRARKWEGLRDSDGVFTQVADGPVVASAFAPDGALWTCTLLGRLARHELSYDEAQRPQVGATWKGETKSLAKVNAISVSSKWIVLGGITQQAKGLVEVWAASDVETVAEEISNLSM